MKAKNKILAFNRKRASKVRVVTLLISRQLLRLSNLNVKNTRQNDLRKEVTIREK